MQDSLQKLSIQLDAVARQINRADLTERLRVEEAASQNNSIVFGVVGLPRSGKSTLLNALLEREVLPTDIPSQGYTSITIANAEHASVSYANGERKKLLPTPPTLAKASTHPDVSAIEVQYPVSWLTTGTRMLEAPGIRAQQQDAFTYVLAQASVLLFVTDARRPMSQLERSFLYDLPTNITRLIVAATRFDQIAGAEEQGAAYQRISESIAALNLKIPVEVFRVAPQIILTNQYERTLLVAWGHFRQAILMQQSAHPELLEAASPQPYGVLRVSTLQAVAQDLQNALLRFQPEVIPEPPPLNEQQKSDLSRTYKMLSRIIADQASDIKQVMEDNFNAFLYKLQDSLKKSPLSTLQIEQRINSWLEEERARIETRFQRLYKSILTDAGGTLKQKLEFSPEKLQFRHVHYAPTQRQSQPSSLFDGMPPEQRLILLGGAAVAVVIGALNGPIGWTLLAAGTGLVGITLYIKRGYRQAGGSYMPVFDKFDIVLPVEFSEYIESSAKRLQAFIDQPFNAALEAAPVVRATSVPTSPALTELQRIQAELARLSE